MAKPPRLYPIRESTGATNRAALVFVHGFSGVATSTWGQFPDLVAKEDALKGWDIWSLGYPTSLSLDVVGLWAADPDLGVLAKSLRTTLNDGVLDRYTALALVAHSMGGLVVQRALVDDPALATRVVHVVLFGTPSNGLVKAWWARLLKRQLRDMAAGSRFIKDLRARWQDAFGSSPPFTFRAAAGDRDQFVPPESSVDPFPPEQQAVVPGNHLEIVKPEDAKHTSVAIVRKALLGDPSSTGDPALVAVEKSQFKKAIAALLPRQDELDLQALVQLALALDSSGRRTEAIAILEKRAGSATDALGTLAGRIKRRWLVERREADGRRAQSLYVRAYDKAKKDGDHTQAYYNGINVAFMELAFARKPAEARRLAREVLDHCARAEAGSDDHWRFATEGEARLLLREPEAALAAYGRASAAADSPRERDSMFQQAIQVASLTGQKDAAKKLAVLFGRGAAA